MANYTVFQHLQSFKMALFIFYTLFTSTIFLIGILSFVCFNFFDSLFDHDAIRRLNSTVSYSGARYSFYNSELIVDNSRVKLKNELARKMYCTANVLKVHGSPVLLGEQEHKQHYRMYKKKFCYSFCQLSLAS